WDKVDRIIKYEAAAGSGKTYQLTFEYLKHVIQLFDSHLQSGRTAEDTERLIGSILAITFTNKAANEMKERILEKLKRFSLCAQQNPLSAVDKEFLKKLSRELKLDEGKIVQLSALIIERIISHYHDFNVKTIDSLMSSIIKVISPDLNLPPDFEIGLDAGDKLREKARQFIENICHQEWEFFKSVLSNIKNSKTLHQWNIDEVIISYLVDFYGIAQYRGIEENVSPRDNNEQIFKAVEVFRQNLSALFSIILSDSDPGEVHPGINRVLVNHSLVSAVRDFIEDSKNLKKIDPIIDKKMFTLEDCTSCFKKNIDENFRELFSRKFQKTRNHLAHCILLLSLNRVSHFSQFFSDYLRFWESERKIIFVNEFSRTLRKKLSAWEKSALPYIYLKLSDRFRHFLFDEFQDTSELQFKALVPILEEVLVSEEKSSIFIVGDPKQAIYRWRGGNAELMNEDRLRKELGILNWMAPEPFTYTLNKNYRSAKSIVHFNNYFWDAQNLNLMLMNLGTVNRLIQKVQENFDTAKQEISSSGMENEGFVQISILDSEQFEVGNRQDDETLLYDKCEQIIRMLERKGYQGSDIAILTRSNDEGREMVRFLESRGVPTLSDESLFLSSSPAINEIICFFRFIDYPPDNLSFYTFICGDIFKKRAKQKFPLEMENFDESLLMGKSSGPPLYKQFKEDFPECWKYLIEPFLKQSGFSPPYDIFQDLTLEFQLYENFQASVPFFLSFGSILHDLEQREINSIASLLSEWEKNMKSKNPYTINVSEDETRIRVLTMHKAKGLEFTVVIIPLREKTRQGDGNLFWKDGDFYHISKDYARVNSNLKDIYLEEIERSFIDELNLLYVSFTRARDAMYVPVIYHFPRKSLSDDVYKRFKNFAEIVGNHPWIKENLKPDLKKGDSVKWNECVSGKLPDRKKVSARRAEQVHPLSVHSKLITTSEWQKEFLVFSSADLFTLDEKKAIERGEAIHRVLSHIEVIESKKQIGDLIKPLMNAEDLGEDDFRRLSEYLAMDNVFCFFNGDMVVHNEKAIAGYIDNRIEYRRIDRLVIKNEHVLVIDFKTGSQKIDLHSQQIKDYIHILKPLFPEKTISGYLLYLDLGVVERVPC
ncbi:MAG: UvrD-helicase domain-containing protein, partial [Candidatus Aminicenantes bacterium]|nr:UvrD-helicase domain-containing protein [Candidatus Aminicenantes bacterium]